MTIIVVIVTSIFVGPFAVLGCGIYILFIPLQSLVAKLSGRLRRKGKSPYASIKATIIVSPFDP